MCSHYQAVKEAYRLQKHFGVSRSASEDLAMKADLWPGYLGGFIRAYPQAGVGDEAVPSIEHCQACLAWYRTGQKAPS